MPDVGSFSEANVWSTPIRDLGLTIAGTVLEPLLVDFEAELAAAGIRLRPRFYLSTEWGVPFDTVAIAIPFYLARPELTALHARHTGHVEGLSRGDILRYLRHEMGHVINYAHRLYDDGASPGLDWRAEYADWPQALAKLEFCAETMHRLADVEPLVTSDELDEDVATIDYSVEHYYNGSNEHTGELPRGLDGALRAIFDDLAEGPAGPDRRPVGALVLGLIDRLPAEVYRWTGHFPEMTRNLLRQLARRADERTLAYDLPNEPAATLSLTTFITALAMNHVRHGNYLP